MSRATSRVDANGSSSAYGAQRDASCLAAATLASKAVRSGAAIWNCASMSVGHPQFSGVLRPKNRGSNDTRSYWA